MSPAVHFVDVPARALERRFGPPVDGLELFRRKAPDAAIPIAFDGALWLKLDDLDAYRAHYLAPEPTDGRA